MIKNVYIGVYGKSLKIIENEFLEVSIFGRENLFLNHKFFFNFFHLALVLVFNKMFFCGNVKMGETLLNLNLQNLKILGNLV